MRRSAVEQATGDPLTSLHSATGWLNSEPLTPADLRGNAVLINFWTFTCINWLRSLPYVRAWAERYQDDGLRVIGVHSPEFEFEHDIDNVRGAATQRGVAYPIAVDNEFLIWRAFDNHYWPALYFVDSHGQIRHAQFGEGGYQESEMLLQDLLAETGLGRPDGELVTVDAHGVEAPADWDNLRSPETYLGSDRGENFASVGGAVVATSSIYSEPARLSLNHWALSGEWTVERQCVRLDMANGRILHRFHARDLHLVMRPDSHGDSAQFRVLLDGRPPGEAHGLDVDEQGVGFLTEPRLYQLIRQRDHLKERTIEITFLDPGVRAYVFTFG
jgi:hypothetical protein